jgi:internalin A
MRYSALATLALCCCGSTHSAATRPEIGPDLSAPAAQARVELVVEPKITAPPTTTKPRLIQFCGQTLALDTTEVTCTVGAAHDLTPLAELTRLRSLELQTTNTELAGLDQLSSLRTLRLRHLPVSDVTPVAQLRGLQELELEHLPVSSLDPLAQLTNLERLKLTDLPITDMQGLAKLTNLKELSLSVPTLPHFALATLSRSANTTLPAKVAADVAPLAELSALTALAIDVPMLRDLSPLARLTGLKRLQIVSQRATDLRPLAKLVGLESLGVYLPVSDLRPLSELKNLQALWLGGSTRARDLQPITLLADLEELQIESPSVSNVLPLARLKKLKSLDLTHSKASERDVSALAAQLPNCEVTKLF